MTFLLFVMVIERVLLWVYWSWECWQSSICLALKRKRRKEKKAHINWNAMWSFTPVACPGAAAELVSKVLGRIPSLNTSSESLSANLLQLFGDSSKCHWYSSAGSSSATIQLQSYMKLHGNLCSPSDTVCRYLGFRAKSGKQQSPSDPQRPNFHSSTCNLWGILNTEHNPQNSFQRIKADI